MGRLPRFDQDSANARNRRICVIAGISGKGRLTDPTPAARRKPGPAPSESFGEVFEMFGKSPVAHESRKGALDHPAARQDKGSSSSLCDSLILCSTFCCCRRMLG